jgi:hypothetical protein
VVIGGMIALLGVAIVVGTHIRDEQMCFYPRGRGGGYGSCLATDWDGLVQILVAFSAAFVAFLCLVQPTRRRSDDLARVSH